MMNTEIESVLEFDRIREAVAEYSMSGLGKHLAKELKPITDLDEIERMLNICSEAKTINSVEGGLPLRGLWDIRPFMRKAAVSGSILEPEELLYILYTVRSARNIKNFFDEFDEKYPMLFEIVEGISVFADIEEGIDSCIDPEGEILDTASPELFRIRRQIFSTREKITKTLESILRSPQYQPAIQEDLITLRNNRYVIPIKQGFRGNLPGGVVQGRSASGVTLFMEPAGVVEMNNQLHELMDHEIWEIRRILQELTEKVRQALPDLEATISILADLDLINAKSLFCLRLGTTKPEINNQGYIDLIQARHPILQMMINSRMKFGEEMSQTSNDKKKNRVPVPEKVVPIDFRIGKDFTTLVITGPNTGGKTVTLKTVGLLTLMMQAGLHVPAKDGSQMAVFDQVFADIGDEQSIEQNLSTFSSHITRIIGIIENLDESSLVLLDELGAGTEPSEGSALGMAILDYIHSCGVRTIATTHHDSLKAHAYSQMGMENASVKFDLETLQPTYELRIGMPGSSNAIKIADRLGLPKPIVENARAYLQPETLKMTDLLSTVEQMQEGLEEQRRLADEKILSAHRTQQEHEKLIQQLKNKRKDIEREALREASQIVQKSKTLVDDTIAQIRQEKASEESIQRARKTLNKARDEFETAIRRISQDRMDQEDPAKEGRTPDRDELKIGDPVYVKSLQCEGILSALPDAKDMVQITVGSAKVSVSFSDIQILPKLSKKEADTASSNITQLSFSKKSNISSTLNLRGYRTAEALKEADKYLDDAALAGLESISLVHGNGTGALREAITALLSEHPHVASFRSGEQKEGGTGVTVVQLR